MEPKSCKRGHPYPENLRYSHGRRDCKECNRQWQRDNYERHRKERGRGRVSKAIRYISDVVMSYEESDCLFWPFFKRSDGWTSIVINDVQVSVTRYVCALAHGEAPSDIHHAAHSCGNGHLVCVNKNHLRWATPFENNQDKFIHGTVLSGENAPSAKLSDEDVVEIRRLAQRLSYRELSERFGVSLGHVTKIAKGQVRPFIAADRREHAGANANG